MRLDTIAAYTFNADIYCPSCIQDVMPDGDGDEYDGWGDATGLMSPEEYLDGIAIAFGIDRADESTFDSDEFPKVVLKQDIDPMAVNICGRCFGFLGED